MKLTSKTDFFENVSPEAANTPAGLSKSCSGFGSHLSITIWLFFVRKQISFYFVLHSICFPSKKLHCCKIHKKYFPFRLNISEKVVMFTQWHFCLLQTLLLAQEDRDCIAVDRVDTFDTIHHLHKFFEQFSAECRMYWKKNGLKWPINNSLPRTILDYILD